MSIFAIIKKFGENKKDPMTIGVINGGPAPPKVFFTSMFHRLIFFTMNATIHSTDSFARCYKNKLLIQTTVIDYHLMVQSVLS